MKHVLHTMLSSILLLVPVAAGAQEARLGFGGDQYAAGQNIAVEAAVERDAFVAGSDVSLNAPVSGDAHLAGFDVNSTAAVSGNIYALGYSVDITGAVGGDVTAAANSVTLRSAAPVAGNARLAGATVTIATPISGSALVSAQSLTLDAPISGDVSFYGETMVFAPGARVDGVLSIQAPGEIVVPPGVASADRVKFTRLVAPDYVAEAGRTAETVVKRFWPQFWIAVAGLLLLFLIGAAMISLMPKAMARMQIVSETRPLRNLGLGVLAFAAVLGLVPVIAMTLVGILLLPFVFIFIAIASGLAYVAGSYLVGLRISKAFFTTDTNLKRLGILALALIAAVLLGMIPFVGWFVTLALLIFGLGTFAVLLMVRWSAKDAAKLQEPAAGTAVGTPSGP